MKVLTLNLLTCARKACKSSAASFPLHPQDAEMEVVETPVSLALLTNILPKLEWEAVLIIAREIGLEGVLPEAKPAPIELVENKTNEAGAIIGQDASKLAKVLHRVLIETTIQAGKLTCANCRHEYAVKEGVANFLLPAHLV